MEIKEIKEIKELYNKKMEIQKEVDKYSKILNSFPSDKLGLVSEEVRLSKEYREALENFNKWFKVLQMFNSSLTNKQKRELNKYKKSLK